MWPSVCGNLCRAPKVLAVGDLHVNSFGTWRDAEGRLCWGVDDFDEAYPLAYTSDLVRLATSLKIVIDAESLSVKFKDGCDAILEGYRQSLRAGGYPVVLAEREQKLGKLGVDSFKPPTDFWEKLNRLPAIRRPLATNARRALEKTLPEPRMAYKVVRRQAGLGSLGQQRFVAIGMWQGGFVAREAKATLPSACSWLQDELGSQQSFYERAIRSAVRSPDPFQVIEGSWLIRRLSPDSNPIDIQTLPKHRDEQLCCIQWGRKRRMYIWDRNAKSRLFRKTCDLENQIGREMQLARWRKWWRRTGNTTERPKASRWRVSSQWGSFLSKKPVVKSKAAKTLHKAVHMHRPKAKTVPAKAAERHRGATPSGVDWDVPESPHGSRPQTSDSPYGSSAASAESVVSLADVFGSWGRQTLSQPHWCVLPAWRFDPGPHARIALVEVAPIAEMRERSVTTQCGQAG
jgi:hypothetical protein